MELTTTGMSAFNGNCNVKLKSWTLHTKVCASDSVKEAYIKRKKKRRRLIFLACTTTHKHEKKKREYDSNEKKKGKPMKATSLTRAEQCT